MQEETGGSYALMISMVDRRVIYSLFGHQDDCHSARFTFIFTCNQSYIDIRLWVTHSIANGFAFFVPASR